MADDLELPTLPNLAITPSSPVSPLRARKRARYGSPIASSDPPVFSSDDDPSLDQYTRGRHQKKQYRGPWFRQEPAFDHSSYEYTFNLTSQRDATEKGKRVFERQYDSGVFLGSDYTDTDDSTNGFKDASPANCLPPSERRSIQTSESTVEDLARKQIEHCIDYGIESIDLSFHNLKSLSNETIRPLGALTPIHPRFDGTFFAIEPKVQLYLTSNELSTLPEELFNLKDLTVLSVRGNNFHELPPAIGKLRSLMELNVSQNNLQYLPYEILDLFSKPSSLAHLQLHPNPFYAPKFPIDQVEEASEEDLHDKIVLARRHRSRFGSLNEYYNHPEQRSWDPKWEVCYRARTEVRYFDINGSHRKGLKLSNDILHRLQQFSSGIPVADANYIPVPPTTRSLSRVPSLLELALNACSKTPELPSLLSMLPDDHPEHFSSMLADVATKKDSGGSKCTICARNFIVARTEWIEWWEIARAMAGTVASVASPLRQVENNRDVLEKMVPLIRRGCSWLCVPEKIMIEEDAMVLES